jgi:hypothetical protein
MPSCETIVATPSHNCCRLLHLQAGQPRRRVAAHSLTSNDIKNGLTLDIDGSPWRVIGESFHLVSLRHNAHPCCTFCELSPTVTGLSGGYVECKTRQIVDWYPGMCSSDTPHNRI